MLMSLIYPYIYVYVYVDSSTVRLKEGGPVPQQVSFLKLTLKVNFIRISSFYSKLVTITAEKTEYSLYMLVTEVHF